MSDNELTFEERFRNWSSDHPRQWHVESDTSGIVNFLSVQTERIVTAQVKAASNVVASQERIASEIDRVAIGIDRVAEGLESLAATFEWGFSELVWQLEEQRKVLQDILTVLQAPLDTQARELKKRAEYAYRNGWFEDALEDFIESEKKNRYDFTIHQNLGNIYLFEKRNPAKALDYYEKAAKYAAPKSPYHASIAFLHIGLVRYLQGDFKEAFKATSKALSLSPYLYEAHYQHAQYCANLGKYSEAIEHLKIAIEGDRYYCVKADSERDFNTMKKRLTTLFEELRRKAHDRAEAEIDRAKTLFRKCKAYGLPPQAPKVAQGMQSEADSLFGRNSYFDYLDASRKAFEARAFILDSSQKYLSTRISEASEEYDRNAQRCRKRADSDGQKIFNILAFSAIIPVIPSISAVLIWLFVKDVWGCLSVGFLVWFFSLVLLVVYTFLPEDKKYSFLYKRCIRESEESYGSELAVLKKNLSEVQENSAD